MTDNNKESLKGSTNLLLDDKNILFLPGDCILQHEKDIIASAGTYLKNGYLFASVAGYAEISQINETNLVDGDLSASSSSSSSANKNVENKQSTVALTKRVVKIVRPNDKKIPFLEPGCIVTARVLRLTSSFVKCSINCIEDYVLKQPYTGIIRQDDIRDYDRDKVSISRCFRPGDIILARVYASSENHQFLLTTAAPELGVVIATNDWGEPMIPISLTEVLCQRTYSKEPRKVAKIDLIA